METKTTVLIKMVSSEGHSEFNLPVDEALALVQDKCANEGKWFYKNGDFQNVDTLTVDAFNDEKADYLLANQLAGG